MNETYGTVAMNLGLLPHGNAVHPEILLRYINNRCQAILSSHPWTRLNKTFTIQIPVKYDTGTVAITNGATTVTLTGGTFTQAMDQRRIRIATDDSFYVLSFTDGTHLELDRPYEGTSQTTAAFRIWQAVFGLPADVDYFKSISAPRLRINLKPRSRDWLNSEDPSRTQYGDLLLFVAYEDDATGQPQIELYRGPEVAEGVTGEYRAAFSLFGMDDQKRQFPDWLDTSVLFDGVEADLYALAGNVSMKQVKEADYKMGLQDAITQDISRMPSRAMQMDEAWTWHRIERAVAGAGLAALWNQDSRWGGIE